jgi:hypothetical protein
MSHEPSTLRHCEERSDEATQGPPLGCFVAMLLAMTSDERSQ